MTNYKVPFFVPDIDQREIDAVTKVLNSKWITTGPMVEKFEQEFSQLISNDKKEIYSIAVNSATAGLHLALLACDIRKGDEVITSTLTFTATTEAIENVGAKVKLVDIDPLTMNMNIEELSRSITKRTKAILPVHYSGLSCDMDPIIGLAKKHNIKIIEDAAHALASTYKKNTIGSLDSDVTVFSFYANKTITTGEGGMAVTSNRKLAENLRITRYHGIDKHAFQRETSQSAFYQVITSGYKYNLTDIAASIGIEQLKKLPEILNKRHQLAERYFEDLKDLPLILPPKPKFDDIHPWHLFVIRLREDSSIDRDNVMQILLDSGVQTSLHYIPIHRHPYWKNRYSLKAEAYPHAENAFKNMISIPLFTSMTDTQQNIVIKSLHEALA